MTATEHIDPTKAVGRLLVVGWRVDRTVAYDGGTYLLGAWARLVGRPVMDVPHGELVEVVIEDPPADDVAGDVRQAVQ